jgi:hypothetical protein
MSVAADVRGVRPEVYKYGFWLPRDSTRCVERTVAIEAKGGSVAKRVQRSECVTAAGTTVLARRAYADIIVHYAEHSSP